MMLTPVQASAMMVCLVLIIHAFLFMLGRRR